MTDEETEQTVRKKEKYAVALKTDYQMWEKGGLFGNLSWLKDEPSGIRESVSVSSGFGRIFRDRDGIKLSGGLGLEGFREIRLEDTGATSHSVTAGYMQWKLVWKFNEHGRLIFTNNSRVNLSDSEDYRTDSNLSFQSAINSKLAVELAYQHQYRNVPVDNRERTDTTTTINLVFKF